MSEAEIGQRHPEVRAIRVRSTQEDVIWVKVVTRDESVLVDKSDRTHQFCNCVHLLLHGKWCVDFLCCRKEVGEWCQLRQSRYCALDAVITGGASAPTPGD